MESQLCENSFSQRPRVVSHVGYLAGLRPEELFLFCYRCCRFVDWVTFIVKRWSSLLMDLIKRLNDSSLLWLWPQLPSGSTTWTKTGSFPTGSSSRSWRWWWAATWRTPSFSRSSTKPSSTQTKTATAGYRLKSSVQWVVMIRLRQDEINCAKRREWRVLKEINTQICRENVFFQGNVNTPEDVDELTVTSLPSVSSRSSVAWTFTRRWWWTSDAFFTVFFPPSSSKTQKVFCLFVKPPPHLCCPQGLIKSSSI